MDVEDLLFIKEISRVNKKKRRPYLLQDDSANDDCAIDKMAAKFSQTDDSAPFFWKKKAKKTFFYSSRASLKDLSYPSSVLLEKTFTTPHGVFLPLAGVDFWFKETFPDP